MWNVLVPQSTKTVAQELEEDLEIVKTIVSKILTQESFGCVIRSTATDGRSKELSSGSCSGQFRINSMLSWATISNKLEIAQTCLKR